VGLGLGVRVRRWDWEKWDWANWDWANWDWAKWDWAKWGRTVVLGHFIALTLLHWTPNPPKQQHWAPKIREGVFPAFAYQG